MVRILYGPLARYAKLQVAHAPGMPGTFSPPPLVSDSDMHHGTCVTHVPWCMPGSLSSGFLWSRWRGKRSRHSRCMRNARIYVSGKRPIGVILQESNASRAKFQYGRHLSWWPHWVILKSCFPPENGSRWSEKIIFYVVWACRKYSQCYKNYSNVRIVAIWPPISKMATIGYHVILSCQKMATDRSNDDLGDTFQDAERKLDNTHAVWVLRSFQYRCQFPRWSPRVTLECYHLLWIWQQAVKKIIWQ